MQDDDYLRLKNDLQENGYDLKQPIYLYQDEILDGWNRFKACQELKIQPIYKDFSGSEIEAMSFVMRTNKRRNLTSSQWAAIAVEADEFIQALRGEAENVRRKKISEFKKGKTGQLIAPSESEQNKTRTKLATTFNTNRTYINEAQRLKETNPEVFQQVKSGEKTLTDVKKEEKKQERQNERKIRLQVNENIDYNPDIRKGKFQDVCKDIADNSIDHIITDPPYPKEYLQDWSDLGEVAKRILKPGGFCITYSGQYHMIEVLNRMTKNLDFYWQLILLHTGSLSTVHPVKMNVGYKPIFIFYKTPKTPQFDYVKDVIIGTGTEKFGHEWQQSEGELDIILNYFTKPGDLILDPFAGSGTTGFACMKNNRRSILMDINDI